MFYISQGNVGIMEILEIAKKLFQRPAICKLLNYVTLICNHKAVISPYSRKCKNLINLQFTYPKQTKKASFVNFENYSKDIFDNH